MPDNIAEPPDNWHIGARPTDETVRASVSLPADPGPWPTAHVDTDGAGAAAHLERIVRGGYLIAPQNLQPNREALTFVRAWTGGVLDAVVVWDQYEATAFRAEDLDFQPGFTVPAPAIRWACTSDIPDIVNAATGFSPPGGAVLWQRTEMAESLPAEALRVAGRLRLADRRDSGPLPARTPGTALHPALVTWPQLDPDAPARQLPGTTDSALAERVLKGLRNLPDHTERRPR